MTDFKKMNATGDDILKNERKISLLNENERSASANLESDTLVQKYSDYVKTFKPYINAKDPHTFAFYGKSEKYYEDTVYNVINYYPFDGTLEEVYSWYQTASHLDSSLVKQYWPASVGHVNFNYSQYIQFYSGPEAIEQITTRGTFRQNETGLRLDASKGNTVEFWLKKEAFNVGSKPYEIVFDIGTHPSHTNSNTSANFRLTMSGSQANPLRLTYKSGSTGVEDLALGTSNLNAAAIADSKWHHYALKVWQKDSSLYAKLYIDGEFESLNTANVPTVMNAVDKYMGGTIGAIHGETTGSLSGSIDTFRFWKGLRNSREITRYYDQKVYASDLANTNYTSRLGLQYNFNKSCLELESKDSAVIDTSGNTITGKIYNYVRSSRVETSAIDLSEKTKNTELKDPILISDHPSVTALELDLKRIAKSYDSKNNALLINNLPSFLAEEEFKQGNNKDFINLLHLIATQFDEIKLNLDSIRKVSSLDYTDSTQGPHADPAQSSEEGEYLNQKTFISQKSGIDSTISSQNKIDFAKKKLTNFGLSPGDYDLLWTAKVEEIVESIIGDKRLERDIQETRNLMYEGLANAASFINKKKGTENSYDAVLNSLGLGREVVSYNIYGQNADVHLNTTSPKQESCVVEINSVLFSKNNTSTIHMTKSLPDESSYISADSIETEYTIEGNFIFPRLSPEERNYEITESSVFGIQQVGSSQNNLTTTTPNNASFIVKVVKPSNDSTDAKFVLSSDSSIISNLETRHFRDVYDNSNWNLCVRVSKNNDNKFIDLDNPKYIVEFIGHNYVLDELVYSFHETASITKTQYINFRNSNKTVFIGAHNANIVGSSITKSDIKFLNLNAWKCALSNEELQNRARTITYSGINRPHFYIDLNSEKNRVFHNTALFKIGANGFSELNASGKTDIKDEVSGSAYLADIKGQDFGTKYPFTSTQFSQNMSSVVQREYLPAVENIPLLNSHSLSGIESKEVEFDYLDKTANPEVKIVSFEKSMNRILSKEMLSFLSGISSYNNLIGDPVNKYRKNYKLLDHLRTRFFLNVKNENQMERFTQYYRWIDKAIGEFLSQLVPASVSSNTGIENVVESHSLERNKFDHKLINIDTKDLNLSTNLLSINELLYNWNTGHAPVGFPPVASVATITTTGNPSNNEEFILTDANGLSVTYIFKTGVTTVDGSKDSGKVIIGISGATGHAPSVGDRMRAAITASDLDVTVEEVSGGVMRLTQNTKGISGNTEIDMSSVTTVTANSFSGGIGKDGENKNCVWQRDRKKLEDNRDELQKVLTTKVPEDSSAKNFRRYALRNLSRPYKHTIQVQEFYTNGHNRSRSNIPNFYKVINEGKEIRIKSEDITNQKSCGDVLTPVSKQKVIAKSETDRDGGYTDGKAQIFLPFSLYSSSVGDVYEQFNSNVIINGIHSLDFYNKNSIHRNVEINTEKENRPEAYRLSISPNSIVITRPQNYRPVLSRDLTVSRLFRTANVKTDLIKPVIGNYKNEYEIIQTNSKHINNSYLVDTEADFLAKLPAVSPYLSEIVDFSRPERTRRSHVIKNIFNSPGSSETSQIASKDLASEEYSVYNTMNLRNSTVRQVYHNLSVEHSVKGGYRPVLGLDGQQQGSIHKTYRNPKRRTSTSQTVDYDNFYIQNHIPQSDYGYSWITASVSVGVYDFLTKNGNIGHQHNYNVSGNLESSQTITFLSASQNVSFLGLNTYATRSILDDNHTLSETTHNLNTMILNRQGPYGWASWKQIRAEQHPVVRQLRKNNYFSISFRGEEPEPRPFPGASFDYQNTIEDGESKFLARIPKKYDEVMVTNRFRPLFYSMHAEGQEPESEAGFLGQVVIPQINMKNMWYYDSFINSVYGQETVRGNYSGVGYAIMDEEARTVSVKTTVQNEITTYANRDILLDTNLTEQEYQENTNLQNLNYFIRNSSALQEFPTALKELNYVEKIYPREINTYTGKVRGRQLFTFFGWSDNRSSRSLILSGNVQYGSFLVNNNNLKMFPKLTKISKEKSFKKSFYDYIDIIDLNAVASPQIPSCTYVTSSRWVLDSRVDFSALPLNITSSYFTSGSQFMALRDQATRGEGILQNDYSTFALGINNLHGAPPAAPLYNRRIPQTYNNDTYLSGESKWEAADNHPIGPFYEDYEKYAEELRLVGQNYSLIPEFTISKYIDKIYENQDFENVTSIMDDFLEVTGTVNNVSSANLNIGGTFFKTYSTSDFLKYFEPLRENIEDNNLNLIPGRLTLRCRAVKRFLPYRGFYPAERVVQLSEIFNRSYLPENSYLRSYANAGAAASDADAKELLEIRIRNSSAQAMKPLFSPGVLMNSIKAGVAVDYPIFSSSVDSALNSIYQATNTGNFNSIQSHSSSIGQNLNLCFTGSSINSTVDSGIPRLSGSVSRRINFDDLLNPINLFDEVIHDNEPHPSGTLLYGNVHHFSAIERPSKFGNLDRGKTITHTSNEFEVEDINFAAAMRPYESAINNFTAETVNFFLEDGKLQTLISDPVNPELISGVNYKMRVHLKNNQTTMYDRHSAFGPPVDDGDSTYEIYTENTFGGSNATNASLSFVLASPSVFDISHITGSSDLPAILITDESSNTYQYKFYNSSSGISVSDTSTIKHINVNSISSADDFASTFVTNANTLSIAGTFSSGSGGSVSLQSTTAGTAPNSNIGVSVADSTVSETVFIADSGGSNTPSILSNNTLSWSSSTGNAAALSIALNAPATSKHLGSESAFANTPSNYPFLKVIDESSTEHTLRFFDSNGPSMNTTDSASNTTYIDLYSASTSSYRTTTQLIDAMKSALESALAVSVTESPSGSIKITLDAVGVPSNADLDSGNCFLDSNTSPCSSGNNISTISSLPSFSGGTAASSTSTLTFQAASAALEGLKAYGNASSAEGGYGPGIRLQDGDGTTHTFYFYNSSLHTSLSNTTTVTYIALSATNTTNATNFKNAVDAVTALNISTGISSNVVTLTDTTTGTTPSITELAAAGERVTPVLSGIVTNSSLSWTPGAPASNSHTILESSSAIGSGSHGFLPYVPPFLDPGTEPYAEISYIASRSGEHSIPEIINGSSITYYNMDQPVNHLTNTNYKESMNLFASLNLTNHVKLVSDNERFETDGQGIKKSKLPGSEKYRWVIQTRWETPVLDFTDSQVSALNLQTNGVQKVTGSPWKTRYQTSYYEKTFKSNTSYLTASTGMWHQNGSKIPHEGSKGYVLGISGPKESASERSLAALLGFTPEQNSVNRFTPFGSDMQNTPSLKKIGKVAKRKEVFEAVVAIPYYSAEEEGEINLFPLNELEHQKALTLNQETKQTFLDFIRANQEEEIIEQEISKYNTWKNAPGMNGAENIAYQLRMMDKYIIPPHFDFTRNPKVEKHVQYIFQFKSELNQDDLSDMWQNLYPGSGKGASVSSHSHVSKLKPEDQEKDFYDVEYITGFLDTTSSQLFADRESNYESPSVFLAEKVRWLIFKAKYRGYSDYQDLKKSSIVPYVEDIELYNTSQRISLQSSIVKAKKIQEIDTAPEGEDLLNKFSYNWPYDYFSIVELAEVQTKTDFYKDRQDQTIALTNLKEAITEPSFNLAVTDQDVFALESSSQAQSPEAAFKQEVVNSFVTRASLKDPSQPLSGQPRVYTISQGSVKLGSESIYLNGVLQSEGAGADYVISGNTITFNFDPESEDSILVNYIKE